MKENDAALSHAEYWDERYSQAQPDGDSDTPMHEWFRSFGDLEEFFQKYLLQFPGRKPDDDPSILHLGSGDSVSYFTSFFFMTPLTSFFLKTPLTSCFSHDSSY